MISWAEFQQLDWSHPWWALLALQPLLMMLLLKMRRNQVLHYADAHLLAWVVRGSLGMRQDVWSKLFNLFAWLLLGCAMAGPRLPLVSGNEQEAVQRHEMDIMVVLDVSPSMRAQDVSPQRLQRAKLELLDLLPRLHGERLGLIAFSGSAGLVMPLSRDYSAMRYYLQMAEPSLFDKTGTAIASALDLAVRRMPVETSPNRAILLLTDAETSALSGPAGTALWEAADKLRQANIKLFILGVGTAAGTTIPLENGNNLVEEGAEVVSRMDADGFTALAKVSDGKFAVVEDGEGDWRALYDNGLLALPGGRQPAENVLAWQELYARFLFPALLLFLMVHFPVNLKKLQVKRVTVPVLLLFMAIDISRNVYAAETEAYAAYRSHQHTLAQTLYAKLYGYNARMGEGAAAYRRKDYQYAIRQFSAALLEARDANQREQALYNLGNSYFMAGGFRAAADAFNGVLKYAPENQAARANLALSAGKLAELGKSGKKSQGIQGRRGRQTGGSLGQDASDKTLFMEEDDKKKIKSSGARNDLVKGENARLGNGEKVLAGDAAALQAESEQSYNAALKKLELTRDNPTALHKALVTIEAAKEYVPQLEMPPW
jgi:Ca-activated chloride channel family protein